jgi:hypothetical protein
MSKISQLGDDLITVASRLEAIERHLARLTCPRCTQAAPPPPRWPGDVRSCDTRPGHTCGRWTWAR